MAAAGAHYPPIGSMPPPAKLYNSTRSNMRYSFCLLFTRWRGSVYKLVWKNLAIWLFFYYVLSIWYRFGMGPEQKKKFEFICRFCDKYNDLLPTTFVLGFYVSHVLQRWWTMWDLLPWTDNAAFYIACAFPGQDEHSRILRRTIVRYMNLASVYGKSLLSSRVKKRFPTMDHFVEAGLMTENERRIIEGLMQKGQKLYYVPLLWAMMLLTKARNEQRITEWDWNQCATLIVDFRSRVSRSLHIELVNIPLVYSQVVALSVYSFALSCVLGRQFIQTEKYAVDMYFPIFTVLQLVFYWGWLNVAESMIDPYGEDDADFDLNYYIDKNIRMSYMIVDAAMGAEFPDPVKDAYWEQQIPEDLPYTDESKEVEAKREHPDMVGTLADVLPNAECLARQLESTLSTSRKPSKKLRRRHSNVKDLMNRLHPSMQNRPSFGASTSASNVHLCGIAEEGGADGCHSASFTNGGHWNNREIVTRVLSAPPNPTLTRPSASNAVSAVTAEHGSTPTSSNTADLKAFDIPAVNVVMGHGSTSLDGNQQLSSPFLQKGEKRVLPAVTQHH